MLTYILFAIGLLLLIKSADFLVDGAASIARSLNISDLFIGLTVVAFGTSTPELFVNIVASAKGNSAIAIGNVLGSNIANIFLILGISSVIYPLAVSKGTVWKEIPFSLLAAIVLLFMANDQIIDNAGESGFWQELTDSFFSVFLRFLSITHIPSQRGLKVLEAHVPAKAHDWLRSMLLVIRVWSG